MSTVSLLRKIDEPEHRPESARSDGFDLPRLERAVREMLLAVGEDPDRDGLRDTPQRVARAYRELLSGLHDNPARHLGRVFDHRTDSDDLVLVRDIEFSAYVAALYIGDGAATGDALADVPKRLELSYFWSIRGADFGKAGDQILAQNVDARTLATLRPRLDRINAWYRDVKPGDRYSLTYVPGAGTELALNGSRLGIIDGTDFASAYFRTWLGDTPIDTRLRDQLLGCDRRDVENKRAAARSIERVS
jgi:hypothetical protein